MAKAGSQRQSTIESLRERIARDPLSRAFLQLAEEYRKEGRYKEAVEVCLEGLARHPTYHTARISLGRTYMEAGDLQNARRAFSDVLELQPENHLAGKLLAEVQKNTVDLSGAAETYRAILSQYPNDKEVEALLRGSLVGTSTPAPSPAATRPSAPNPPVPAPVGPAPRPLDPSPEFRAEDLGGADLAGATEVVAAPAGPSAASDGWAMAPEETDGEDALQTNTLGELYLRQGLVDRAIDVYRGMLRVDPGNQKAARRLNELLGAGADLRTTAPAGRHAAGDRREAAPGAIRTPAAEPAEPPQASRPNSPGATPAASASAPAR